MSQSTSQQNGMLSMDQVSSTTTLPHLEKVHLHLFDTAPLALISIITTTTTPPDSKTLYILFCVSLTQSLRLQRQDESKLVEKVGALQQRCDTLHKQTQAAVTSGALADVLIGSACVVPQHVLGNSTDISSASQQLQQSMPYRYSDNCQRFSACMLQVLQHSLCTRLRRPPRNSSHWRLCKHVLMDHSWLLLQSHAKQHLCMNSHTMYSISANLKLIISHFKQQAASRVTA